MADMIFPRSAYDKVGGLVYFARMLDKIRKKRTDQLPVEYCENLGLGFDGRCVRFLYVDYKALLNCVLGGGDNEEILDWCFQKGHKPSDEEILVWNGFMVKRGWKDKEDGSTQKLEGFKAGSGLSHRKDLVTFFDYFEVDEGRSK